MKKILLLLAMLFIVSLLIFGCTKSNQYPTGYQAYGQQGGAPVQQQPYVGGGCGVAGPEDVVLSDFETIAAA